MAGLQDHLAQGFEGMGKQQGAGAKACRSRRRLAAGMASTDDDDVIAAHGGSIRAADFIHKAFCYPNPAHRQDAGAK